MNGGELEIKAVVQINALILNRVVMQHISGVEERPLDMEAVKRLPGFLIYTVQPSDTLWDIAKAYHTTVDGICQLNELGTDLVKQGEKILIVKQMENL